MEVKKRVRFIPASTVSGQAILVGIRCDFVTFEADGKTVYNMVIALDENEGSFGGYCALVPSSVVGD